MTEQCKIYLDPWDKNHLEGTAMLIDRIPDTYEATYRGVTCQRWLARFAPDQDNAKRWLDYTDAEPYDYPELSPYALTLGSPDMEITDASPAITFFNAHGVTLTWISGNHVSAFRMPHDGYFRGASIVYTTAPPSANADLTILAIRKNDYPLDAYTLSYSTTSGGPYSIGWTRTPPKAVTKDNLITAGLTGPQPAGEFIRLTDIIVSIFMTWK